jgi:hypothetical protein
MEGSMVSQNLRHSIIADAIEQMVLVVISRGFSNAFVILVKPHDEVLHLFNAACGAEPKGCPQVQLCNLAIFLLYILLLTNWLYLSITYRDNNPKKLWILPDAIGIFLTGLLIGVQSSYASADLKPDFYFVFSLVLLVDAAASIFSIRMNWEAVRGEGLCQELLWVGNNLVFGAWILVLVVSKDNSTGWPDAQLMAFAYLNSAISLLITWGYFRT